MLVCGRGVCASLPLRSSSFSKPGVLAYKASLRTGVLRLSSAAGGSEQHGESSGSVSHTEVQVQVQPSQDDAHDTGAIAAGQAEWETLAHADDWAGAPTSPQTKIQDPPATGMLLLMALIVGLAAAAWQLSRLLGGYQEQRTAERQEAVVAVVHDSSRTDASNSEHSPVPTLASAQPETAPTGKARRSSTPADESKSKAEQPGERGSSFQVQSGAGVEQSSRSSSKGAQAGGPTAEALVFQDAAAIGVDDRQRIKSTGVPSQQGLDIEPVQSSRPAAPEPLSSSGSTTTTTTLPAPPSGPSPQQATKGGTGSISHSSATGLQFALGSDSAPHAEAIPETQRPVAAESSSDVAQASSLLPSTSVAPVQDTSWADTSGNFAEVVRASSSSRGTKLSVPGTPESVGQQQQSDKPASIPTGPTEASSAFKSTGSLEKLPPLAFSAAVPSTAAVDELPQGRSLNALRERANLALRAAAAASEASQRAAASSAAASTAASQAADFAERAAAAATQAQSALENEAEGAIAAAEQHAQQAAVAAKQAERRAKQAAESASTYQDLGQVQASIAARAAQTPKDSGRSSGRSQQWTVAPMEFKDAPSQSTPFSKSFQGAWQFLLGQGQDQVPDSGAHGQQPAPATHPGGGGGARETTNYRRDSSSSTAADSTRAAKPDSAAGGEGLQAEGQGAIAGALGKASSAVKGFWHNVIATANPPMDG